MSTAATVGVAPEQGVTLAQVVADLMLERQQIELYRLIREIGDQDLVARHMLIGILAETETRQRTG